MARKFQRFKVAISARPRHGEQAVVARYQNRLLGTSDLVFLFRRVEQFRQPIGRVSLRDARTPQSRQDVIDSFSQKLRTALAQDPEKYSCNWRLQLILISKKQG